jgi:hypothetical protein
MGFCNMSPGVLHISFRRLCGGLQNVRNSATELLSQLIWLNTVNLTHRLHICLGLLTGLGTPHAMKLSAKIRVTRPMQKLRSADWVNDEAEVNMWTFCPHSVLAQMCWQGNLYLVNNMHILCYPALWTRYYVQLSIIEKQGYTIREISDSDECRPSRNRKGHDKCFY